MYRQTLLIFSALLLAGAFASSACGEGDKTKPASDEATSKTPNTPSAKPVASPTPTKPAAKAAMTCVSLGCTGTGKMPSMCKCQDKPVTAPLKAVATGGDASGGRKEFTLSNTSDKDIEWASVRIYYYDKDGKQLEAELRGKKFKMSSSNGSTMKIGAKASRKLGMGFRGDAIPAGTKTVQAVFDGWCYGDVRTRNDEFCVRIGKAPEQRPMAK